MREARIGKREQGCRVVTEVAVIMKVGNLEEQRTPIRGLHLETKEAKREGSEKQLWRTGVDSVSLSTLVSICWKPYT